MPESHASPEQFAGWLPQGERADTAPLTRDNSRVKGSESTAVSDPATPSPEIAGEATSPAFPQRPPSVPTAAPVAPAPRSGGYSQTMQRPAHAPYAGSPAGTSQPQSPAARKRITPWGWAARGLILCAISVVSGLIWHAIKPHSPAQDATPPAPRTFVAGSHTFTLVARQESAHNCQSVSTSQIASLFARHECDHLTRALYTTTLANGQQVLTSVVTVLMPDPATARELNTLATRDGTGNVEHLPPPDPQLFPELHDYGYSSQQQRSLVVIGDSAYFGRTTSKKDPALVAVTTDALQLGWPQDGTPQK